MNLYINGYKLVLTCGACPEQYDVYAPDGKQIGYLRLRHGRFTAQYPDYMGSEVYSACPNGDGRFDDIEREHYLTDAVAALQSHQFKVFAERYYD